MEDTLFLFGVTRAAGECCRAARPLAFAAGGDDSIGGVLLEWLLDLGGGRRGCRGDLGERLGAWSAVGFGAVGGSGRGCDLRVLLRCARVGTRGLDGSKCWRVGGVPAGGAGRNGEELVKGQDLRWLGGCGGGGVAGGRTRVLQHCQPREVNGVRDDAVGEISTFLAFVEDGSTGVVVTWLFRVGEGLAAALVRTLLFGHCV